VAGAGQFAVAHDDQGLAFMLKAIQKVEQVAFMHQAEPEAQGAVEQLCAPLAAVRSAGRIRTSCRDAQFALRVPSCSV
jgi:hypothetical protein